MSEIKYIQPMEIENRNIYRRIIHTSADFDYADINKKSLEKLGGTVHCFIGNEDVAKGNKSGSNISALICNALLYRIYRG